MNNYDDKFGFTEDEKVRNFHRSRRMFCIKDDELCIAEEGLSYSHPVWFEKEGWMTKDNDSFMEKNVRGFVNKEGDIYFYKRYNFEVDEESETIMFSHLKELIDKLGLDESVKVFGGQDKDKGFAPRKEYGSVKNILEQKS